MSYSTVTITSGSGGPDIALDAVSGASFQRMKIVQGAEGAATDVSEASPLPVKAWLQLVAAGAVADHTLVQVSGRNEAVGTTYETIRTSGGDFDSMTAAQALDIVSSDANDTSAGTGARTVDVIGLDSTGAAQTETVTMNGTTAVTTVATNWNANAPVRIEAKTWGTGGENAGDITAVGNTDTGNEMGEAEATENDTLHAIYTVPASTTAYLVHYVVGYAAASSNFGEACVRLRRHTGNGIWKTIQSDCMSNGAAPADLAIAPIKLDAGDTIKVEAKSSIGSATATAKLSIVEVT